MINNENMRKANKIRIETVIKGLEKRGIKGYYAEDGEEASEPETQVKPVPMNKNSMILVFGVLALIGVGAAGFFLMKKKNGGTAKTAVQFEPEYDDDTEITEDEDDMRFYDNQDDEE